LRQLAENLKVNHAQAVLTVALLLDLAGSVIRALGKSRNMTLQPMIDLQRSMALNWVAKRGIDLFELDAACKAVRRAGATANLLDSLPA
jgi:hypothetical protein